MTSFYQQLDGTNVINVVILMFIDKKHTNVCGHRVPETNSTKQKLTPHICDAQSNPPEEQLTDRFLPPVFKVWSPVAPLLSFLNNKYLISSFFFFFYTSGSEDKLAKSRNLLRFAQSDAG